jgi:hypothetical protein
LDGPDFTFPGGDPRLDAADLYVFSRPGDPSRLAVIFDVNPFAAGAEFHPGAVYRIGIDTNGDAVDDLTYFVTFDGDPQAATVRRATGLAARGAEPAGDVVVAGAPVSLGTRAHVTKTDGYRFFAGRRSEPAFFDIEGAMNGFRFTGTDSYANADIFSIALEAPAGAFGATGVIGLWARVSVRRDGALIPVDRVANPGLTMGFTEGDLKARFIADEPSNDVARYADAFVARLVDQSGYAKEEASDIVRVLLPDLLHFDGSRPSGLPNGRRLEDHWFDEGLTVLTRGALTSDGVKHHTDYSDEFPYLGTPHMTPPPLP